MIAERGLRAIRQADARHARLAFHARYQRSARMAGLAAAYSGT